MTFPTKTPPLPLDWSLASFESKRLCDTVREDNVSTEQTPALGAWFSRNTLLLTAHVELSTSISTPAFVVCGMRCKHKFDNDGSSSRGQEMCPDSPPRYLRRCTRRAWHPSCPRRRARHRMRCRRLKLMRWPCCSKTHSAHTRASMRNGELKCRRAPDMDSIWARGTVGVRHRALKRPSWIGRLGAE